MPLESGSVPDAIARIRRLKKRVFELTSQLEVTRDLMAADDEATLLKHFLRSVIFLSQATSAAVFRYDAPTGKLRLAGERNLGEPGSRGNAVLGADEVRFLEGPDAREGIAFRAPRLAPEARDFAREQGAWLAAWEIEALVPLVARGRLWGAVALGPRLRGRPFGRLLLGLLAGAAQIAASALESLSPAGTAARTSDRRAAEPVGATGAEPADLASLRKRHPTLAEIIGESPSLVTALRELTQVAPTRFPVLILGPTGTGKELAARAVHQISPRAAGPFEVVDCGAIPRELIESELFGHVRGAFTGATRDRRGAFELAHGGTLFLDEIGELPAGAQTRLLRVLQEGQLRRVGDERTVHVNVRVVAATNRDLFADVDHGRFRPDLYYRVSVFTVRMPSLAERRGDVPILAKHLLAKLAAEAGRSEPRLSQAVLRRLAEHPFPGNVRELQNVLTVLLLRSGAEGPSLEDVEAVLSRPPEGRGTRSTGGPLAGPAGDDEDEVAPERGDAEGTGRWVLEQLRKSDFNLSQAERALARLRRSPAGRAAAPVADRSSLTYYLQGECFKAFCESEFDLAAAARTVAQMPDLESQARARLARFLEFVAEVAAGCADEDSARRTCRQRLPKLPAHYLPYLDRIAASRVRGEWSPSLEEASDLDRSSRP